MLGLAIRATKDVETSFVVNPSLVSMKSLVSSKRSCLLHTNIRKEIFTWEYLAQKLLLEREKRKGELTLVRRLANIQESLEPFPNFKPILRHKTCKFKGGSGAYYHCSQVDMDLNDVQQDRVFAIG